MAAVWRVRVVCMSRTSCRRTPFRYNSAPSAERPIEAPIPAVPRPTATDADAATMVAPMDAEPFASSTTSPVPRAVCPLLFVVRLLSWTYASVFVVIMFVASAAGAAERHAEPRRPPTASEAAHPRSAEIVVTSFHRDVSV